MAEFVPISELPSSADYHPTEIFDGAPSVLCDIHLPESLDLDRIEVNLSAFSRMHRFGAFSGSVLAEYQGDRSEYTPGLSGVNANGTASATRAGSIRKADLSSPDLLHNPSIVPDFRSEYGRPIGLHRLNKPELASRVSDLVQKNRTREAAWASELDNAMHDSFKGLGRQNLTEYYAIDIGVLALTNSIVYGFSTAIGNSLTDTAGVSVFALTTAAAAAKFHAGARSDKGLSPPSPERRNILLPFSQSDRYVAMSGIGALSTFVRSRT